MKKRGEHEQQEDHSDPALNLGHSKLRRNRTAGQGSPLGSKMVLLEWFHGTCLQMGLTERRR